MAIQKDYKAIASIIKSEYIRCDFSEHEQETRRDILTDIATNIAGYFDLRNKWFNRDTFISECGIQ